MFAGSLESRCEKNPPNQLGQSREFDGANGSEQLHQMDQQSDLLSRLSCMSQQELDQMNAVLDQCQILDNGQILFGSACGGYSNNTGGSLPLTDNLHQYRFDQQPPPQTSQHREQQVQQKQYLQRLYLQQLQLHNEEQKKFDAAEAARQRQAQASPSCASLQQPFHRELPVYFDAAPSFAGPPYPIAQQLAGEIAQQRAVRTQINGTPPFDIDHLQHPQQPPPLSHQRTPPDTWVDPVQGVTNHSAAPVASIPKRNSTAGQQPVQPGRGRRPSRGRSHTRIASASARREQALHHLHTAAPLPSTSASTTASASLDANVANGPNPTSCTSASADDELMRLQDLSIMHRSTDATSGSASSLSMTSSTSTATITGPTTALSTTSLSASPSHTQPLYLPSHPPPLSPSRSANSQAPHINQSSLSSQAPPHQQGPLHPSHQHLNYNQNACASSSLHHLNGVSYSQSDPHSQPESAPNTVVHQPLPLQPSDQATLSPKKQRTVSSSPKKPGRLESIYASIRNKTANMRRSRTTFTHEAAPSSVVPLSTVAPLATLRDATFLSENSYNNIQSHHIHSRSSNCGDLDLDLALELDLNLDLGLNLNAKSAAMGSFPPTPPLTGVASSLSSASSSFSMSACSSVASSAADSHLFSHPLAAQVSHNPLYSHNLPYQHPGSSEEDLSHVDMATFVSGVVDDPFADSGAYFGNCSDMPVHQHQHHQPLPLHTEAQYPPQRVSDSGVSSACWPTSLTMPNSRTPPLQQQEDNDVTPVTLAMNIPGRTELLSNISPSAYLANAAANMSGAPVIASANASVAAAAAANMMKQKALGNNAMDIDENWWQDCVVDSAVGEPLQASSINFDSVYGAASSLPAGYPCDHIDNNTQALGTSGNMQYCMPDLASQGLMIDMAPVATNPGGAYPRSQYYFPGIAATSGGNAYPPGPPAPLAGEYESRHDRASASSRRSKPRAPSAGARYHSTSRGDGLHSPRKRPSATNLSKTNSSSSSAGFYSGDSVSGISAAMMTAPSTPRSHHQLGRRSHSMQNLSRTSPTPGGSGSMGTLSNTTTPSKGAIQKRRSAGNLRRVSSTQGITSLTAAAAITAAVGATGMPEPKTPRRQRSTSADPSRPRSVAANSGAFFASEDNKFFNFTASDHQKLMSGVAPSGSSKTKARRERALQEKTRKLSEQLMRAMQEAGGDVTKLEAEGLKDLAITL